MRVKVILTAVVLAVAAVVGAIYFRNALNSAPAQDAQTLEAQSEAAATNSVAETNAVASAAPIRRVQPAAAPRELSGPVESGRALTAPNHADYVRERQTQLMDLATSDDPGALHTIVIGLSEPDPAIRQTALTAIMDVGNPDAIPMLQNQMTLTDDLYEKVEIQKAIDFLQLPPVDQVNAEITAAKTGGQAPATGGKPE